MVLHVASATVTIEDDGDALVVVQGGRVLQTDDGRDGGGVVRAGIVPAGADVKIVVGRARVDVGGTAARAARNDGGAWILHGDDE